MDRILKILKKENGPRASSAPALELDTIIFKHVYWYMQQISGERLQDHWSSGLKKKNGINIFGFIYFFLRPAPGISKTSFNLRYSCNARKPSTCLRGVSDQL